MGNKQSTSTSSDAAVTAAFAGVRDASYEELGSLELHELLLSFQEQLAAEFLDQDQLGQYSLATFVEAAELPQEMHEITSFMHYCSTAIKLDETLAHTRFRLVPQRISENVFWSGFLSRLLQFAGKLEAADSTVIRSQPLPAAPPPVEPEHTKKRRRRRKSKKRPKASKNKHKKDDEEDDDTGRVEQVLLGVRECFVYNVPARTHSAGHYAQRWMLDQPLWTGRLQLLALSAPDELLFVRLLDARTGVLFAQSAPIPVLQVLRDQRRGIEQHIEPVLDSSRYFVVRFLDSSSGTAATLGIGFRDRSSAFDFNASIADHLRRVRRKLEQPLPASEPDADQHQEDPDQQSGFDEGSDFDGSDYIGASEGDIDSELSEPSPPALSPPPKS